VDHGSDLDYSRSIQTNHACAINAYNGVIGLRLDWHSVHVSGSGYIGNWRTNYRQTLPPFDSIRKMTEELGKDAAKKTAEEDKPDSSQ